MTALADVGLGLHAAPVHVRLAIVASIVEPLFLRFFVLPLVVLPHLPFTISPSPSASAFRGMAPLRQDLRHFLRHAAPLRFGVEVEILPCWGQVEVSNLKLAMPPPLPLVLPPPSLWTETLPTVLQEQKPLVACQHGITVGIY